MRGKDSPRSCSLCRTLPGRDHPRVCGEKLFCEDCNGRLLGSPPRMRGKVYRRKWRNRQHGITPAYAGKSCARELLLIVSRDHPRVCGEKHTMQSACYSCAGSPPRMRGKVLLTRISIKTHRDHPRVCGEKHGCRHLPPPSAGSPPRMRGKVPHGEQSPAWRGITPAYAGKS